MSDFFDVGGGVTPWARRALGLAGLVILADVLFWKMPVGLSVAVFVVAVFLAAIVVRPPVVSVWRGVAVLVLGLLPVVEYYQPLSLGFAILGLAVALCLVWVPEVSFGGLSAAAVRLMGRVPFGGAVALWRGGHGLAGPVDAGNMAGRLRGALRGWALPLGGCLVFAALMLDANPVLVSWLSFDVDAVVLTDRALFWGGMALVVWPFVEGRVPADAPMRGLDLERLGPVLGVNATSVMRSLWMFNALIAVQTVLDVSILFGGAALPEGMGFAQYAHRGAYPLLATALLAGTFAVLARPFLEGAPVVRWLMMLWIAQNVLLCVSAGLRLDIYVAAYGLTYLRVYALVWMGVVAVGLGLIGWQVWHGRSNAWLVLCALGLCLAVLFVCAFVNFAALIARHNVSADVETDWGYVCGLGAMAAAEIAAVPERPALTYGRYGDVSCDVAAPVTRGWRDWGWREQRVRQAFVALR